MIDYANTSLTIQMTEGMLISTLSATTSSNTVNGTATVGVTFQT